MFCFEFSDGIWYTTGMKMKFTVCGLHFAAALAAIAQGGWPEPTREMKPWTYNWWMGSAVDKAGLEAQAEAMEKAGIGGFHVIPIYGAKGYEAEYREFLSPKWMDAFATAKDAASAHGLGIDLTTGTGWCFGGKQLTDDEGCRMLVTVKGANPLAKFKPAMKPEILWQGKDGDGSDVALVARLTQQKVKRAGPGGEGPMMDPFSASAMDSLLEPFTAAFDAPGAAKPEYMYHDSYEYYNASWTPGMFDAFKAKRGYDLREHLAELAGVGEREQIAKVKCDYRETLSDLIIEDVFPKWIEWCHSRGIKTRNEAHGAPANLLDFYALADIPETEMFGCGKGKGDDPLVSRLDARISHGDRDILISKMASSAAHVKQVCSDKPAGCALVSSESCTWMAEHFCETLEGVKGFVDRLFLAGVNHIYYHGTCYSPVDAAWPGWCFYASLEMNPRNPIWRDVPALNEYFTRVQSVFQTSQPDEDLLVYWPIRDFRWNEDGFEKLLAVHALDWFHSQPFGKISKRLHNAGFAFDYISDRQIAKLATLGKTRYSAILVPDAKHIPPQTLAALDALAEKGYSIIHANESNAVELAQKVAVREPFCDAGLMFTRQRTADGDIVYFLVNQAKDVVDEFFPVRGKAAKLMDPVTGCIEDAPLDEAHRVRIRLPFGHSVILKVCASQAAGGGENVRPATSFKLLASLAGPWKLAEVCGGPEGSLGTRTMETLVPWSSFDECPFSGTVRYETSFTLDAAPQYGMAKISLGEVRESARVFVNGREIGVAYRDPKEIVFDARLLRTGANNLAVEVTSTGANRLRDLDRRGVKWRIFHDINMVDYFYKPFDAAKWPLAKYGLLGPVEIFTMQ